MRVDVSRGETVVETLPGTVARDYLGGRGLCDYLLFREQSTTRSSGTAADPLIFAPGALVDSGAPAADRYSVCARSPLTGTAFDGSSAGAFGVALSRSGLDFLLLTGASDVPAVLVLGETPRQTAGSALWSRTEVLEDGGTSPRGAGGSRPARVRVSLFPAADLWGRDVPDTLGLIDDRFGPSRAAVIGPAGERGLLFATIANERGRQLGRGGLGAVMGSRRLKAVVLAGFDTGRRRPPAEGAVAALAEEAIGRLRDHPTTSFVLPTFGTAVLMDLLDEAGVLPRRNFLGGHFEAAMIDAQALQSSYGTGHSSCRGCPVGCARRIPAGGRRVRGPEYQSLWALGADCGVDDLGAVVQAYEACGRAGLDTISMGATIACAMELAEAGELPGAPRFGDAAAVPALVATTVARRGLGDELALGSARLAARHRVPEAAMVVKGLEIPGIDPRGMTGQGLAFATSNRGACHQRANLVDLELVGATAYIDRFATCGKSPHLIRLQDRNAVLDSLGSCSFAACALPEAYQAELLSAVWGETIEVADMRRAGSRIWHAERLFNLAAGFARAGDTLPPRLLHEPLSDGPAAGHVVDLEPMLDEYYDCRGWDRDGRPRAETLAALSLG